ncbi:hypothetical protein IU449_00590 [Nocardia higoensis]|uniref:Uncharacterized protein n=1 Tax=Nocardia higoensis TaxID=228599 RepID=A0ABS0D5G8_9NOCA|nr:hypothetical protein [Nocardia higoensis]MBF6353058.1 hypothetical protein [Nocardia higoensis]
MTVQFAAPAAQSTGGGLIGRREGIDAGGVVMQGSANADRHGAGFLVASSCQW